MPYTIVYHPKIKEDIELLDRKQREIVAKAIESRLGSKPEKYERPLRGSLKGYWKLRVGDTRVVFKVVGYKVQILGIINRKPVYEQIVKRL